MTFQRCSIHWLIHSSSLDCAQSESNTKASASASASSFVSSHLSHQKQYIVADPNFHVNTISGSSVSCSFVYISLRVTHELIIRLLAFAVDADHVTDWPTDWRTVKVNSGWSGKGEQPEGLIGVRWWKIMHPKNGCCWPPTWKVGAALIQWQIQLRSHKQSTFRVNQMIDFASSHARRGRRFCIFCMFASA